MAVFSRLFSRKSKGPKDKGQTTKSNDSAPDLNHTLPPTDATANSPAPAAPDPTPAPIAAPPHSQSDKDVASAPTAAVASPEYAISPPPPTKPAAAISAASDADAADAAPVQISASKLTGTPPPAAPAAESAAAAGGGGRKAIVAHLSEERRSAVTASVGAATVELCLSAAWEQRQRGLTGLQTALPQQREACWMEAVCELLQGGLVDKVALVYQAAVQLTKAIVDHFSALVPEAALHRSVTPLLPLLVQRTGNSNARTRQISTKALIHISRQPSVALAMVAPVALRPIRNTNANTAQLGRLQLLQAALWEFGLSDESALNLNALMAFVLPLLMVANEQVRKMAVSLVVDIHQLQGPALLPYLTSLPPQVSKTLHAKMSSASVGPPPLTPSHASVDHRSVHERLSNPRPQERPQTWASPQTPSVVAYSENNSEMESTPFQAPPRPATTNSPSVTIPGVASLPNTHFPMQSAIDSLDEAEEALMDDILAVA